MVDATSCEPDRFGDEESLVGHLRKTGLVICTDDGGEISRTGAANGYWCLHVAGAERPVRTTLKGLMGEPAVGIAVGTAPIAIPLALLERLRADPNSNFWKHTTRRFDRSFVFVDVSDFSKIARQLKLTSECSCDATDRFGQIPLNQRGRQPQHPPTHSDELLVATRIRGAPRPVIPAVDFHDEAHRGSGEIHDEPTERHLAPEADTEPPTTNHFPKLLFRRREGRPHLTSEELHASRNVNV